MLSSLMPLLCRHDFYWSERRQSDRCRRCGKLQAETLDVAEYKIGLRDEPCEAKVLERPKAVPALPTLSPPKANAKVLKAQARERRETLVSSLHEVARGRRPSCDEALDLVLAVIEDAHASDPVLFGPGAAGLFAQLDATRRETARLAAAY